MNIRRIGVAGVLVVAFALMLIGCEAEDPYPDNFRGTWVNDEKGVRIVAANSAFIVYTQVVEEGGDTWEKAWIRGAYYMYLEGKEVEIVTTEVNVRDSKDNPYNEWVAVSGSLKNEIKEPLPSFSFEASISGKKLDVDYMGKYGKTVFTKK